MSTSPQPTRLFGINFGVDPKYLLGGLLVVAGVLFFVNQRGGGDPTPTSGAGASPSFHSLPVAPATSGIRAGAAGRRSKTDLSDRGKLKIRPVDATRGDVDPTLRLDMLGRLHGVPLGQPGRSLFEVGAAAAPTPTLAEIKKLDRHITPGPLPLGPQVTRPSLPAGPVMNIPFRFYGFVRPAVAAQRNRGLFLNGDVVIAATEGDLIEGRYLVVELTPTSARIEDTQLKLGQNLAVIPAAVEQP